jgi:hypothetical protein
MRTTALHPFGPVVHFPDEEEKQSFELTFEHTEMLEKFGDASSDYPVLSFDEIARKLLGPKPFKVTTKGKQLEKICREVFDRERE